jgi:hypothetical protein
MIVNRGNYPKISLVLVGELLFIQIGDHKPKTCMMYSWYSIFHGWCIVTTQIDPDLSLGPLLPSPYSYLFQPHSMVPILWKFPSKPWFQSRQAESGEGGYEAPKEQNDAQKDEEKLRQEAKVEPWPLESSGCYPLVNIQKTMENHSFLNFKR